MDMTARARASATALFEDGFGRRHQLTGPQGEPLEVLILRDELMALPGVEQLLRQQLDRLGAFQHPAYGRIRGIARIVKNDGGLGIVSEQVRGERLSNLLAAAETRMLPLDMKAAFWMIGQMVAAVALLHERLPGLCHGAIAPERIIVTPDARVVLVEHVLGSMLEALDWPRERYWTQLGIALPATDARPRFTQCTDVAQVAAVGMALLLGHRLDGEYPQRVEVALELLPDGIRGWLARAIQLQEDEGFASAVEARAALDMALDDADYIGAPEALRSFLEAYDEGVVLEQPPPPAPVAAAVAVAAPVPVPEQVTTFTEPVMAPAAELADAHDIADPGFDDEEPSAEEAPRDTFIARTLGQRRLIAAVAAALVVAMATVLAARSFWADAAPAETPGTLFINSATPGLAVVIDGIKRGETPLRIELEAGNHVIELSGNVPEPVTVPALERPADPVAGAPAPASPAAGWIAVKAPAEVQLFEDGRLLGSSRSERIMTAAGRHEIEVVNEALGYRVTRAVAVTAGQTASVALDWPSGMLAVNALPWADVWVDGVRVGETPIGQITLPIGSHEVVFRHPELGEQQHTAVITTNGPARLSVDLRRR
jgi:hypothetical protein